MPITPNYDLDIDTTLGGSNASDYTIASQKAVKSYVDNHSVTTTSSVTSGSTAALTSGGAYTNLVRRLSTSAATGSASQGVYVDANGQVQICTAVTSTYAATGTAPVNGTAVSNAIAVKQDTLVSGTNIKTINGNSLLGSGNITIETSSTPNVDGETISYNSSDALQAIAVKNVRDGSTLPIWHGTEYQWNHGALTTWYYWQTSVTALWTSGGELPKTGSIYSVAYNGTTAMTIRSGEQKVMYSSDDGNTWQYSDTSIGMSGTFITYLNDRFIVYSDRYNTISYSTNSGLSWTVKALPISNCTCMIYGNGTYIAFENGSVNFAYSTDNLETWTTGTIPTNNVNSAAFGDGVFVAVGYPTAIYSSDGINWQVSDTENVPSYRVTFGNGRFFSVNQYNSWGATVGYSLDGGQTWEFYNITYTRREPKVAFGNGVFLYVNGSTTTAFSLDAITWTEVISSDWMSNIAYGNGKFLGLGNKSSLFTIQYDKCYTDTANPTTSSTVYSAPNVTSSYTISSVTSGAITLSNNNTYYYNQSGNAQTYDTIGNSHPEYLCFIDGVGVKIGNTTIATNNSNNS